jgi:hypothetical protein
MKAAEKLKEYTPLQIKGFLDWLIANNPEVFLWVSVMLVMMLDQAKAHNGTIKEQIDLEEKYAELADKYVEVSAKLVEALGKYRSLLDETLQQDVAEQEARAEYLLEARPVNKLLI